MYMYRFRQAGGHGTYWVVMAENREDAIKYVLNIFEHNMNDESKFPGQREEARHLYNEWSLAIDGNLPYHLVIEVFPAGHILQGCN